MENCLSVDKKTLLNSEMIKDYIKEMKNIVKNNYPDIDDKELEKVIKEELILNVEEVPIVKFVNNYKNTEKRLSLLKWYDWYKSRKPITTEHGVCFKKHNEAVNLSAKLLEYILDTRKYHKNKMFECKRTGDTVGEKYHNIRQKVFKIFANSYYGATGNNKAIFYNLFTALSITGKGQSLITNAATSFEQFYADNIYFESMDDVYVFVSNVKNEKREFKDGKCLSKNVSVERLVKRLMNKFEDNQVAISNEEEIRFIVENLTKVERNRVFYKNNLFEFCKQPKIISKVFNIIDNVDSFKDPNKIPKEIADELNEVWLYIKEFVYYPHSLFNRMDKCKKMTRNCVVTVDTDSNMLNIEPWIDLLIENSDNKWTKEDIDDETIFKMVNIMAYILSNMIGEVHERYTKDCNVPEDKRPIINMKNEFLMKRMLLTASKKNYCDLILLQEGALVAKEDSLDIKGLTIKKSNVNRNVGNYLQDIIEQDILEAKEINISIILNKLSALEKLIKESFNKGEVTYCKPDKSSEPSSYKTPFQILAIRGICAWNALYPDSEITYPAQVNLIKLKCYSLVDLNDLMESEPEIYNTLEDKIFRNPNLGKYGFTVIALPKTLEKIPEWIIPYIDLETMVYDSLVNFNKILESIGVRSIGTSANELHYSNIIDF